MALPIVHAQSTVVGEHRRVAVEKFRELANRLASGELDGARVEWREGAGEMVVVELVAGTEVRLSHYRMTAPPLTVVGG
jgi:hypothetical protein